MTDEIGVQTSTSPKPVDETNNLCRICNSPADGTCLQCIEPFQPCTWTEPRCYSSVCTYLFMVIIVGLRKDGHDNGLIGTRGPPRIAMPVSETIKDVLNLCWPCRGPFCALVAPVDCQLPLWNRFQWDDHSDHQWSDPTDWKRITQGETSQGCCACVWFMWVPKDRLGPIVFGLNRG